MSELSLSLIGWRVPATGAILKVLMTSPGLELPKGRPVDTILLNSLYERRSIVRKSMEAICRIRVLCLHRATKRASHRWSKPDSHLIISIRKENRATKKTRASARGEKEQPMDGSRRWSKPCQRIGRSLSPLTNCVTLNSLAAVPSGPDAKRHRQRSFPRRGHVSCTGRHRARRSYRYRRAFELPRWSPRQRHRSSGL